MILDSEPKPITGIDIAIQIPSKRRAGAAADGAGQRLLWRADTSSDRANASYSSCSIDAGQAGHKTADGAASAQALTASATWRHISRRWLNSRPARTQAPKMQATMTKLIDAESAAQARRPLESGPSEGYRRPETVRDRDRDATPWADAGANPAPNTRPLRWVQNSTTDMAARKRAATRRRAMAIFGGHEVDVQPATRRRRGSRGPAR